MKSVVEGNRLVTVGLRSLLGAEIALPFSKEASLEDCQTLIDYVADYVETDHNRIKAAETLAYGYWVVKFIPDVSGNLEVWEYESKGEDFVAGAELAMRYWNEQHRVCEEYRAAFCAPSMSQLVVVSNEVIATQSAVEGVRYPSPEHMSGWWITGEGYDGDPKSLKPIHLFHLTSARPELAAYIALPWGFRFNLFGTEHVWFDAKVAAEEP